MTELERKCVDAADVVPWGGDEMDTLAIIRAILAAFGDAQ